MATQLFLRNEAAPTHLGNNTVNLRGTTSAWLPKALATTRGAVTSATSGATSTVTGPTAGIEAGVVPLEWISEPVSADVTISGVITGNIWAVENSMNANVAINFRVQKISAIDGSLTNIVTSAFATEVSTSTAVNNFTATPAAGVTVNHGDRLRITIFGDDAGTMASGFTFTVTFAGPTAAAAGDTFITFTETFAFDAAPSGTTFYLTDSTALTSKAASTARGAGSVTAVTDTIAGWTAPIQVTAGSFPTTSVLDSFGRADGDPGANWAGPFGGVSYITIAGSAITGVAPEATGAWVGTSISGNLAEAYYTVPTLPIAGNNVRVILVANPTSATTNAYYFRVKPSTLQWFLTRVDGWLTFTTLASGTIGSFSAGDKIGVKHAADGTLSGWVKNGAGAWTQIGSAVDNTYNINGWAPGIDIDDATIRVDDFGGGTATGAALDWYTPRLNAFTLGGKAQFNLRALEDAVVGNASLKAEIAICNSDGSSPAVWGTALIEAIDNGNNGGLTITDAAYNAWVAGDDTSVSLGQRLRLRVYTDDVANVAMATGHIVTLSYAGASSGAAGDTFVILPQSVTAQILNIVRNPAVSFQDPGMM